MLWEVICIELNIGLQTNKFGVYLLQLCYTFKFNDKFTYLVNFIRISNNGNSLLQILVSELQMHIMFCTVTPLNRSLSLIKVSQCQIWKFFVHFDLVSWDAYYRSRFAGVWKTLVTECIFPCIPLEYWGVVYRILACF